MVERGGARGPAVEAVDVVILAGGAGSRLVGGPTPKPLAEIGGRPLLWYVIDQFRRAGFRRYVIALGHGGAAIREWFAEHDVGQTSGTCEVSLVETGLTTGTAGRVSLLDDGLSPTFMVANADGLSTVDLAGMVGFHDAHGRLATVAAVRPAPRFGYLEIDQAQRVTTFAEKSATAAGWINGGYWVFDRSVIDMIDGLETDLERALAQRLAADGELMAFSHAGFWDCVDTPHDLEALRARWDAGDAPWHCD